jgi:hypothetical protein
MDLKFGKDMGITVENDEYHRHVPALQHYSPLLILSIYAMFVIVVKHKHIENVKINYESFLFYHFSFLILLLLLIVSTKNFQASF